jgi:hypothetical protein
MLTAASFDLEGPFGCAVYLENTIQTQRYLHTEAVLWRFGTCSVSADTSPQQKN